MDHSDKQNRKPSVVTLYLDESATDDASPVAVVGGVLLNQSGLQALEFDWAKMLAKYSIAAPLHIKDFRRPRGRLADVSVATKLALFTDVVEIINRCKIYSIAGTLTTAGYRAYFDERFRKQGMSLYGQCFIVCAEINHQLTKGNNYQKRIPILMDQGNQFATHVRAA